MQELHTERSDDATRAALDARCRREGRDATRESRKAVSGPLSGSAMGMAIKASLGAEIAMEACGGWARYDAAMTRYERLVLGRSSTQKAATIQHEPERAEAETHHTVDLRTEDQRIVDAANTWAIWRGYEGLLRPEQSALVRQARHADDDLWWDAALHQPTRRGRFLAHALSDLADMLQARVDKEPAR